MLDGVETAARLPGSVSRRGRPSGVPRCEGEAQVATLGVLRLSADATLYAEAGRRTSPRGDPVTPETADPYAVERPDVLLLDWEAHERSRPPLAS